jgi:hypothetical protein
MVNPGALTRQPGHTSSRCWERLGRRGSGNGPVDGRWAVPAFFDQCDRLKSFRGNKIESGPLWQDEWRQAGSQDQRKGIEQPRRRVIVVRVINFLAVTLGPRRRNTIEMRIEMRVNEPGMIVIRSRSLPGVNVLERR